MTRPTVVAAVREELGLEDATLDDVRALISVEVDPNSSTVNIVATASSAAEAALIANTFARADARLSTAQGRRTYATAAKQFKDNLKNLDSKTDPAARTLYLTRLSNLQALAAVAEPIVVSAEAQVPSSPTSPKPVRNTLAAGIIGLLLGIGIAFVRSTFDRRLKSPLVAQQVFEQPIVARLRGTVFGHTGSLKDAETKKLGPLEPMDHEAFIMLRENVRYLAVDRDLKTILITSAVPEEGKSTVAACLAMASATAARTLLVECDLRKPILAERFGISATPGLSDYLVGRSTPREILQQVQAQEAGTGNGSGPASLVCITAGSPPPRPDYVLNSKRFADFLSTVSEAYERVIIDAPPLLPVADTLEILPHVDCVLMCVRMNKTTEEQVRAAHETLDRLSPDTIGLVITDCDDSDYGAYRDYYRQYRPHTAASAGEPQEARAAIPPKAV